MAVFYTYKGKIVKQGENIPFTNASDLAFKMRIEISEDDYSFGISLSPGADYDFLIDWGDGSPVEHITSSANISNNYELAGTYDISITGEFPAIEFDVEEDRPMVKKILQWGSVIWRQVPSSKFFQCSSMNIEPNAGSPVFGPRYLATSMFYECTSINQDLSSWRTGDVTNMDQMFYGCASFNGDVSTWDVSGLTSTTKMFRGCTVFNRNIGAWNVSRVSGMEGMFQGCAAFNQNIGTWDVSSVTTMVDMFKGAVSFNQNIGIWNTASLLGTISMFDGALAFDQDLSGWNVESLIDATDMFANGAGLSTANYDALLIGWEAQDVQDDVPFHAGTSKYTSGGAAEAARTALINDHNWKITDGGAV